MDNRKLPNQPEQAPDLQTQDNRSTGAIKDKARTQDPEHPDEQRGERTNPTPSENRQAQKQDAEAPAQQDTMPRQETSPHQRQVQQKNQQETLHMGKHENEPTRKQRCSEAPKQ